MSEEKGTGPEAITPTPMTPGSPVPEPPMTVDDEELIRKRLQDMGYIE